MPDESGEIVCPNPKCCRKIKEPILLNSLSRVPGEQYYACPHCFIKLDVDAENTQLKEEKGKKKEKPSEKPSVKPLEKKVKGPSGCPHHFGYLAIRPKNDPISQECLVCSKIVDCMLKLSDA